MRRKLEMKLDEVYNFTVDYIDSYGFPPSVRDICAMCDISSTATAYSYLKKLTERGLLNKSPMKKRAISVVGKPQCSDGKSVPLIGAIRAGAPVFAVENFEEYIPLPEEFGNNPDRFALRVVGESMINAGIYDKDIIIVEKTSFAEDGDIVVALIDDSATVKTFYKRGGKIILHPENDTMSDMVFDNVSILGKVKGLIRKF